MKTSVLPAYQLSHDVRRQLTDIGQEFFDWMESSDWHVIIDRVGIRDAARIAEEIEYLALIELADKQESKLPQAWHAGIASAMHGEPSDCNPYKNQSEDWLAFACGHRYQTENA